MSTSILYHAFGLKGVKYNSTRYEAGVTVFEAEVTRQLERCAQCGWPWTVRKRGCRERQFRMPPMGKRPTFLRLRIWRVECERCGALRWPKLPFVKGKARHTIRFAQLALDLLRWMTISAVAEYLGVSWDLVKDLHKEHLQRKYKDCELSEVEYLGIDEFSVRKGYSYMSIFVDLASGRIVHAVEGKGMEAITPFLKVVRRRARRLKAIAMDMNTGYVAAVREQLPGVDIVFDRYHVAALMNRAIDDLRREQQSRLAQQERQMIKGSRFLLLSNYGKLEQDKLSRLRALLEANAPLFTIYTMKEQLRTFWEKRSMAEGLQFLQAWCQDAASSGIRQLERISKTLMAHSYGLLTYFYHRISSGLVEGINNKIKTLKRQAYGYRDMAYFKLRLYHLHCQEYSFAG